MQPKPWLRNTLLRFLIDENLPFGIVDHLQLHQHDILDVAASPLRGSTDKVLWAKAAAESRIIVTRDLDFPFPGMKPYPAGVILLRVPPSFTASQITKLFRKSFATIKLERLAGNIAVISPGKIRIRPLP